MIARLLHRLVDALALAGETMRRQPPEPWPPCPEAEVCGRCPCAAEDDVCLPVERQLFELGEHARGR